MPLTANFLADFSSFINAAKSATASTDDLVAAAGKVGATLDEGVAHAASSLKTVGQGIADFGQKAWSVLNSQQVKQFGSDVATMVQGYIHEYSEAEAANNRLEQALKNQGAAVNDVMKKYQDLAGHLQRISTFSDEAITDAMSMFTTIGKVGPEEMEKVLTATMNLAAFMKIDLPAAANVMLKAAASDGESIGKLKILLGDAYQKGMSFNDIVTVLGTKLEGQFTAQLNTAAGRTENLKNRMSDLNEVIGEKLNVALQGMMDLFDSLPESVQTFALGAYGIGKALEPVLISLAALGTLLGSTGIGGALASAGSAIGGFLVWIGPLLLDGLIAAAEGVAAFVAGLIGWPAVIIAAIVALAAGIYFYWDEIVAFLGKAVDKIKYFLLEVLPKAFNSVVETVKDWYYKTKYWLYDQFVGLVDLLVKEPDRISDAFKWMFNNVVGFSYVPDMIDGIAKQFGRIGSVMVNPALQAVDDVNAAFQKGVEPVTLTAAAAGPGGLGASSGRGPVNVTVNMSGMLGTDDPQTRSMVSDLVSAAVMQGMRGGRLLGTA